MIDAVKTADQRDLVVILSAQYERTTKIPLPTKTTLSFWRLMATVFGSDSWVWFDLFNEPRFSVTDGSLAKNAWNVWRDGGHGYIGMQTLVTTIRHSASNVIVAEGLMKGKTLAGLPGHELVGRTIVYGVHPYFVGRRWDSPAAWQRNWGYLISRVPVFVDEWGIYEARRPSCHSDASILVGRFLAYLSAHRLGLIAWALTPGVLIANRDLSRPTNFTSGAPFLCRAHAGLRNHQGAGEAVLRFFREHSRRVPFQSSSG